MKTLRILSFFALVAILLQGCVGATGPEGPAGANGVANIGFTVVDVSPVSWTSANFPNNTIYSYAYAETSISNYTEDEVVVYISTTGLSSGPWQAMPATSVISTGDQFTFAWSADNVTFDYDDAPGQNGVSPLIDEVFNVCVIPPSISKKYPNVNFKDPGAAMQLPEMQAAMKKAVYVKVSTPNSNTSSVVK